MNSIRRSRLPTLQAGRHSCLRLSQSGTYAGHRPGPQGLTRGCRGLQTVFRVALTFRLPSSRLWSRRNHAFLPFLLAVALSLGQTSAGQPAPDSSGTGLSDPTAVFGPASNGYYEGFNGQISNPDNLDGNARRPPKSPRRAQESPWDFAPVPSGEYRDFP